MKQLHLFLSLISISAFALPRAPFDALLPANLPLLQSHGLFVDSADVDFEGIVRLSNCSGSLVRFKNQTGDSNALVLTNGHCLDNFIPAGTAIINQPTNRPMTVFNTDKKPVSVRATSILYATMTGTDLALYELNDTYSEIEAEDVSALEFSDTRPSSQTNIEIISGFWGVGFACQIDDFVHQLKEDQFTWTDSMRYTNSGCETYGGTSGSPILEAGTRKVIGVNNTGNESGETCTMNNPCEVDEAGQITVRKGINYGQQTFNVAACMTEDFKIDVDREGCTLQK